MKRTFKTVDYAQALDLTVRLGDCLPSDHLARFVVDSVAQLDLSALYAQYGTRGGEPSAPEVLLGLVLYGYATGVFSSRKIERATYEAVPFRFIGVLLAKRFSICSSSSLFSIIPGATQFTAISGANAFAMMRVSMCKAAFDEQ